MLDKKGVSARFKLVDEYDFEYKEAAGQFPYNLNLLFLKLKDVDVINQYLTALQHGFGGIKGFSRACGNAFRVIPYSNHTFVNFVRH